MSRIEFEEDNTNYAKPGPNGSGAYRSKSRSDAGMIGWLISHGVVRSEDTGEAILIAVIAFNFLASFFILKYFGVL